MNRYHRLVRMSCAAAMLGLAATVCAQAPTFAIQRFQIEGNSLLSPEKLTDLVAQFQGSDKSFADIQQAQEALERAYRSLGFSAVAVTLPEQDISGGAVRFQIIESRMDTLTVNGNQQFSQENILRSLPALRSGEMPNAIKLAENLSLANENPSKRTEITLKISDKPGFVNADVKVEEDSPQRVILSLDNTGQGSTTGDWRLGVAWQHANLFDRDQVLSLQYTTSPTHINDVTQLNIGYRIPLYAWGDSLDLFAGSSNVDAGSFGAASGIDGFVGKGQIAGVRYNLNLQRQGEYDHSVAVGLDWKKFENNCTGLACAVIGADVVAAPLSVSYRGNWTRPNAQTGWAVTHIRNTGWGGMNDEVNYAGATHQPGTVGTKRRFALWRLNATHLQGLGSGWQGRLALNAQFTDHPLIAGEQFGLAGSTAVRGFNEREVARDIGVVANMELYSPNVAPALKAKVDDLRGVFFVDMADGRYVRNATEPDALSETLASVGVGLRLMHQKRFNVKVDLARVVQGTLAQPSGRWMGHLVLTWAL